MSLRPVMTKEEFIERTIEEIHTGWALAYEEGHTIDIALTLGRVDKQTGFPLPPTCQVLRRGFRRMER